jgi:hypothetical protein
MTGVVRDDRAENARTAYQAPRALRLADMGKGRGGTNCTSPGSSAEATCFNGAAAEYCDAAGSGAAGCGGPGSSALPSPD